MALLGRFLAALPLLILSPLTMLLSVCALAVTDCFWALFGKRLSRESTAIPQPDSASVVIPNWNGRELLEKYLPSVVAALASNPQNEIVVVDNGSTDGSVTFLQERFPQVTLVALPENLGFGGGSNAGFRTARNRIVVLLNSDMRVGPSFLQPLLASAREALGESRFTLSEAAGRALPFEQALADVRAWLAGNN